MVLLAVNLRQRPVDRAQTAGIAAATEPGDLRIMAGANSPKYVDASGHLWIGDKYFTGGETLSRPDVRILRTLDTALYQQARVGDFRYDIPLKTGLYELHLHFAEILQPGSFANGGEGSRKFHVALNGKRLLTDFDVSADSGALQAADERVFTDVSPATDGFLHLQFSSSVGRAILSGLELRRQDRPHEMLPVRLVTRFRGHYDHDGAFWESDRFSQGGTAALRSVPVSGSSEPGLFSSERFGNFSYFIPVADGRYTVTLRFAESVFGVDTRGRRLFDIYCNGVVLERELDILRDARAANTAVEKSFAGLKANAQGKLVLSFVPVTGYATVRAIEVVDERR